MGYSQEDRVTITSSTTLARWNYDLSASSKTLGVDHRFSNSNFFKVMVVIIFIATTKSSKVFSVGMLLIYAVTI